MEILQLEPKAIWKNFHILNGIPRPSKKEEKIIAYMKSFGEGLGLSTTVDETGNVLIKKPATPGMEDRKTVILQSHLDMVTQKNNDKEFDFDKDAIQTLIVDGWVTADGTTLGADNGIGVAAIMSVLESKDIAHPPLEAIFTIDEETGMTGAFGLQPGFLEGDILLNLDSEEDTEFSIGCAGGVDVTAVGKFETEEVNGKGISIEIKGLQGGHSGINIHEGRGNSNVMLARFLYAGIKTGFQIVNIDGGGLRNAIPRETNALIYTANTEGLLNVFNSLKAEILNEYKSIEKDIQINFNIVDVSAKALTKTASTIFSKSLRAAHNGVYRMSPDVDDLVEASNNIARVVCKDGEVKVLCLTRSSVESTKTEVAHQLSAAFELAGMAVDYSGDYPGWQPNPHSNITSLMEGIYENMFGEAAKVGACHAGLECGIIGAPYPKMEMISFGPTITGAHSPDEQVNIKSVQKFWNFFLEILKQIPKK